jgi:hypothetical protein
MTAGIAKCAMYVLLATACTRAEAIEKIPVGTEVTVKTADGTLVRGKIADEFSPAWMCLPKVPDLRFHQTLSAAPASISRAMAYAIHAWPHRMNGVLIVRSRLTW